MGRTRAREGAASRTNGAPRLRAGRVFPVRDWREREEAPEGGMSPAPWFHPQWAALYAAHFRRLLALEALAKACGRNVRPKQ